MEAKKFDTIVKARADQVVQKRIERFRSDLISAYDKLIESGSRSSFEMGGGWHDPEDDGGKQKNLGTRILNMTKRAVVESGTIGFPKKLWDNEEARIEKELLSELDGLQKAFLAASMPRNPDAAKPEDEGGEGPEQ